MRSAHTVEQVRAAEQALMARLPEGALMQRAAAGLASAVLDLLGQATARGWCCWSAAATTAVTRCTPARCWRGGVPGERVVAVRQPAQRRAGRPDPGRRSHHHRGAARGTGPRRRRHRRHRRTAGAQARGPGRARGTRRGTGRRRRRTQSGSTSTRGSSADRRCGPTSPSPSAPTRSRCSPTRRRRTPAWCTSSGHRRLDLPDAAVESLQADDVAALLPRPDEHAHKYTRGVSASRRAR